LPGKSFLEIIPDKINLKYRRDLKFEFEKHLNIYKLIIQNATNFAFSQHGDEEKKPQYSMQ